MQLLCFYKQPPPMFVHMNEGIFKKKKLMTNPFSCGIVQAVKENSESQQYKIDPDKAREALKKLDEEIQSLSDKKQLSTPKLKVSEVKLPTDQISGNEKFEISDSFLVTLTAGLVSFTIFYNILFYSVIKPSIDGS